MDYKSFVDKVQSKDKQYMIEIFNAINILLDNGISNKLEYHMCRGEKQLVVYMGDFRPNIGFYGYDDIVYKMTSERYPETLNKRLINDYPFCHFKCDFYDKFNDNVFITIVWSDPEECKCIIF